MSYIDKIIEDNKDSCICFILFKKGVKLDYTSKIKKIDPYTSRNGGKAGKDR